MAKRKDEEILNTLTDFTSKENWDKFFTLRGKNDSFEWYAEWSDLSQPIIRQLSIIETSKFNQEVSNSLQILVPGCGNSKMSELLYDEGFRSITNIDFSKVVISDMLRRNVRLRPEMKWRIMDMTDLQFQDAWFDVVIDKGGLDALMEPEHGTKLGTQYLSEIKRVLRTGGKYICITLVESHVIGLLFSKFRFGWKTEVHAISQKSQKKPSFETFMVVITKENSKGQNLIVSSLDHTVLEYSGNQGRGLMQAFEAENKLRTDNSSYDDMLHSFEDVQLGVKGDLAEFVPGRRFQLVIGGDRSLYTYRAVLLDAKQQSDSFNYHCGVFLVPRTRAHEWLFSSEEGQWLVVESSKAARLIMVFLSIVHCSATMDDIQKDLSPLVKNLEPRTQNDGAKVPFMMASDTVKQRDILCQATSSMTGPIIVEDVVYEDVNIKTNFLMKTKEPIFRRLTFERSLGLVQSEALLKGEESSQNDINKQKHNFAKSRKKGHGKKKDTHQLSAESKVHLSVDHSFLASSYHCGIISGFSLVVPTLENAILSGKMVKMINIGLGAGLLPMFIHRCMAELDIEVVELDPVIFELAREHFAFKEDARLKVHIGDGIQYIRDLAGSVKPSYKESENNDDCFKHNFLNSNSYNSGVDIIIVDADSADLSSGLTCPPKEFVEMPFLLSVKDSLSQQGLFIINLVSRSSSIREMVVSRMKEVFSHLFCLQLEEDVNEVLFALPSMTTMNEDFIPCASSQLNKFLTSIDPDRCSNIIEIAKKIERLK